MYTFDAGHDRRLRGKWFAYGGATFQYSSTQGLRFSQAYGAGIGYDFWQGPKGMFELRVGSGVGNTFFNNPSQNHRLFGSRFGYIYSKTFGKGITISSWYYVRPAWNYQPAILGQGEFSVSAPLTKLLSLR
jgi:hypothetical protein